MVNGLFQNLSMGLNFYTNPHQRNTWTRLCNEVFIRYVFVLIYDEAMRYTITRDKAQNVVYGREGHENSRILGEGKLPPSIGNFERAIEKLHYIVFDGMGTEERRKPHLAALDELVKLLEEMGMISLRNQDAHEVIPNAGNRINVLAEGFEIIFGQKNPFLNGDETKECGYSELICMDNQPIQNDEHGRPDRIDCSLYQRCRITEKINRLIDETNIEKVLREGQVLRSPNLYLRVHFVGEGNRMYSMYYRLSPFFVQFQTGLSPWERGFGFFYHLNLPWRGKVNYIRMSSLNADEAQTNGQNLHEQTDQTGNLEEEWLELWLDRMARTIQGERQSAMIAFAWKDLEVKPRRDYAGRFVQTQYCDSVGNIKNEKTCINLGKDETASVYGEYRLAVDAEEGNYLDIPVYGSLKLQMLNDVFKESCGRQRVVIRGEGGVGKTHTVLSALRNTYFKSNAVQPAIGIKHFEYIIFLTAKKTYYQDVRIQDTGADFSTRKQALEKIAMTLNNSSSRSLMGDRKELGIEDLKNKILTRDYYKPDKDKDRRDGSRPSVLLIVDDLDSMTSEQRADTPEMQRKLDRDEQEALVKDLAEFCQENPDFRIIMTTRYASFSGPDDELELPALELKQTQAFVDGLREFYGGRCVNLNEVRNLHEISRGIPLYIKNLMIQRNAGYISLENMNPAYRRQLEVSMAEFSYNTLNLDRHEGRMLGILSKFMNKENFVNQTPLAFVRLLMYDINDGQFNEVCRKLESVYLFKCVNDGHNIQMMVRDVDTVIERSRVQMDDLVELLLDPGQIPTETWTKTARENNPNELLVHIADTCRRNLNAENAVRIGKLIEHVTQMAETREALGYNMFSHIHDLNNCTAQECIRELKEAVEAVHTVQWIPQMIELFQADNTTNQNVDDVFAWLSEEQYLMGNPVESGELIWAVYEWIINRINRNDPVDDRVLIGFDDCAARYERTLRGHTDYDDRIYAGMLGE